VIQQLPLIYLASESPRRREILSQSGIRFKQIPSRYHERKISGLSPRKLVLEHAAGKGAKAVAPKGARFVLAADTIVWCKKQVVGKPKTLGEAVKILLMLSGRVHFVYTGIALYDLKYSRIQLRCAKTKVYMKRLSEKEIRNYFKQVNPFDKAGAYAIQAGPRVVEKIVGSYTNVMGLPADLTKKMIMKASRTL